MCEAPLCTQLAELPELISVQDVMFGTHSHSSNGVFRRVGTVLHGVVTDSDESEKKSLQ